MMNILKNIFQPVLSIFIPNDIKLSNGKVVKPPKPITPYIVIALIIVTYFSVELTGFKFSTIIQRGNQFLVILRRMYPPDWAFMPRVWKPLFDTIKMSVLGSIIGCALAIPFAIVSSTNINSSKITLNITRVFLSIVRTMPTLIIALIATYIFDIGTFAGTVAITIFTFGIVSKMLYEQIETVDMEPFVAMEALGANKIQAFASAIVPQVLPSYLSISLYNFEINVRNAAILGYVGAGGLGLILDEQFGWRAYDRAGVILFTLFITVVVIESISRYLRERLA
ncbi:phosphonate ABC transporter, permease protein PhnE [Alkaliphilus transvaalensis]|uniref:phosphonate ABC transporter, permease protein PhnE n=1 Tax=Alkaliphilus transvaalensis TaxID=114628 RepID=UPI000A41823A|nr:phosphonate ABC transporter, permease protein PhnE [Alkaliphilus transvaalensis]